MKLTKKIIRNEVVKKLLCKLVYLYIRFTLLTSLVKFTYQDFDFEEYKNTQCILATWHGRVLIMPAINPFKVPACGIVSDHNDGRLIGEVIKQAGVELIFGSTNRRRISALKEILIYIKKGYNFLITPDGPRGPARQVGGAIINIASSTGLLIFPTSCSAKSAKIFKSWDKFMLPLPFTQIEIVFAKPIKVPANLTAEQRNEYNEILRESLEQITILADKKVGIDVSTL